VIVAKQFEGTPNSAQKVFQILAGKFLASEFATVKVDRTATIMTIADLFCILLDIRPHNALPSLRF
jgi:hypothetical protein